MCCLFTSPSTTNRPAEQHEIPIILDFNLNWRIPHDLRIISAFSAIVVKIFALAQINIYIYLPSLRGFNQCYIFQLVFFFLRIVNANADLSELKLSTILLSEHLWVQHQVQCVRFQWIEVVIHPPATMRRIKRISYPLQWMGLFVQCWKIHKGIRFESMEIMEAIVAQLPQWQEVIRSLRQIRNKQDLVIVVEQAIMGFLRKRPCRN